MKREVKASGDGNLNCFEKSQFNYIRMTHCKAFPNNMLLTSEVKTLIAKKYRYTLQISCHATRKRRVFGKFQASTALPEPISCCKSTGYTYLPSNSCDIAFFLNRSRGEAT